MAAFCDELVDLFCQELEAGEGFCHVNAVCFSNDAAHFGGNQRLQSCGVFGHGAGSLASSDDVVQQQSAHLVAGDGQELAVSAANHNADTVSVGVGADDQVGAYLVSQLYAQIETFGVFGVGACYGGEVAVDYHLFSNRVNVLEACTLQSFGNQNVTGAVERSEYDLYISSLVDFFLVDNLTQSAFQECFVGFLAHNLNHAGSNSFFIVRNLNIVEDVDAVHFCCNCICVLGGQLCAVFPVYLVAVVFLGVMACSDVNTCNGAILDNHEGQFGSGTQAFGQQRLDAVCCHNASCFTCEHVTVDTAVVCDGNATSNCFFAFCLDNVSECLSCMTNNVDVHVTQTGCQSATQTCSTKGQGFEETAFDFLFVVFDSLQFLPFCFAQCGAVQPTLVFFFECSHWYRLP